MLPPGLETPSQVIFHYDRVYHDLIKDGKAYPFMSPHAALGFLVAFLYLLFDHRRSSFLQWARYFIFAIFALFQTWGIWCNRARTPAAALGSGLLSAFTLLSVFAMIMSNDSQCDFKRLERKPVTSPANDSSKDETDVVSNDGQLYWQPYPKHSIIKRIEWVTDMWINFRGVGWNWQISGIPTPPQWTDRSDGSTLDATKTVTTSRTGIRRLNSRSALLKSALAHFLCAAIVLDVTVCIMHNDPYFWGYTDAPAPAHLLMLIRQSPVLLRSYRLLVCLTGIYAALFQVFSLGPIFFVGVLGPKLIGLRGEAWMNPLDTFGSLSGIANHGLAGWWGGWWHQTFRFTFEAPANVVLRRLGLSKRSTAGKAVAVVIVFFLSGFLHACGSYTQLGDTQPLMGPMRFFLLQAVGMLAQNTVTRALRSVGATQHIPHPMRQLANFSFVLVWMYHTAPMLVDDFARGGAWLYEPSPISISRGLGYGPHDEGWYAWWYGPVWIRHATPWYNSGLQM